MLPLVQFGSFSIPSYVFLSVPVFMIFYWVLVPRARKFGVSPNQVVDLSFVLVLSAILGARFLYVVVNKPEFFVSQPGRVLAFWEGGFSYFGGFFAAIVCGTIYLRYLKVKSLALWLDLFAPICALGNALRRAGCFLAGCCYGRSCDLPWAVNFPPGVDAPAGKPIHPVQIYFVLWELGAFLTVLIFESKFFKKPKFLQFQGASFCVWVFFHAVGRIFLQDFRGDQPPLGQALGRGFAAVLLVAVIVSVVLINRKNGQQQVRSKK